MTSIVRDPFPGVSKLTCKGDWAAGLRSDVIDVLRGKVSEMEIGRDAHIRVSSDGAVRSPADTMVVLVQVAVQTGPVVMLLDGTTQGTGPTTWQDCGMIAVPGWKETRGEGQ